MKRSSLYSCVSWLLLAVMIGEFVPSSAFQEDELCRRHVNCSCKASECTCKDEEVHRYDVDQCAVSSDDCAPGGKSRPTAYRFEGLVSLFHHLFAIRATPLLYQQTATKTNSPHFFGVFHPPNV